MIEVILEQVLSGLKWLIILGFLSYLLSLKSNPLKGNKKKPTCTIVDVSEKILSNQQEFTDFMEQRTERSKWRYEVKKTGSKLFLLEFIGSVDAEEVEYLREEINSVLFLATPGIDEVLIKIESGGGTVNGYGLVASQIERLKNYGLRVTCSVDKIAASGGYLAACVADKIIAAPFAYIGSIGVVAGFVNYSELMAKYGVHYKEYTSGEFKRTVSPYRQITQEQEDDFIQDLKTTHFNFIEHVSEHRKSIELNRDTKVFSGKSWSAKDAISIGLVDEIKTSDDYIVDHIITKEKGACFLVSTDIPADPIKFVDKVVKNSLKALLDNTQSKKFTKYS